MSESPSSMLRNTRKHFLKCVDCGGQTLPQYASKEHPWSAAASLYVRGRVNDGALCFSCATKRKETLGLPVENEHNETIFPVCETKLKRVRINTHEYCWEISTLESLLDKWRGECLGPSFKYRSMKLWLVAINHEIIPPTSFVSRPVSDGDSIFIAMGAIAGG